MKNRRNLIVMLALIAYVILFWWWAQSGFPTQDAICEETKNAAHQNCATHYMVIILRWIGHNLLELGTLALAGFVLIQIIDGRTSSERQLRAYVFIEKTEIRRRANEWPVEFTIKNFGKTPAHNVVVSYACASVAWGNNRPDFVPTANKIEKVGSMGPISDYLDFEGSATNVRLRDIRNGIRAIYLVGHITYDTIFESGLITDFRYYVGGDVGFDGPGEMTAAEEGNDAT